MTKIFTLPAILLLAFFSMNSIAESKVMNESKSIYDYTVTNIDGQEVDLSEYEGKVLLIVNTASECGFTPQYEGLQKLHEEYADDGLVVLGFPCNQFGGQEPGNEEEIKEFCSTNFNVSFPLFAKIDVNGENESPLYTYLKSEESGLITDDIKWNFTKFLISKDGLPIQRYDSKTEPEAIAPDIEKELGK